VEQLGELVPLGGGDPIPLARSVMTVGRRKSNDIQLDFANISGNHCEFVYRSEGFWTIRDRGSQNGIKINNEKILTTEPRALRPGDTIAIANHRFTIEYHIEETAREALHAMLDQGEDIMSQSLMEKAGLSKSKADRDDD
jgi:pSer/pThr/pTyr-binding forkhead associated (FHA) protein